MARKLSTRDEMLYKAAKRSWQVCIDGEKGHDVLGVFEDREEAQKTLVEWLNDLIKGKIDPDQWGHEEISEAAIQENKMALKSLKSSPGDRRWSFRYCHDGTKYTVTLDQV